MFLRALEVLGRKNPHFGPATGPVLSCNLIQCKLDGIGTAAKRSISAGQRFRDPSEANGFGSSFKASAHGADLTLAEWLFEATDSAPHDVPCALIADP